MGYETCAVIGQWYARILDTESERILHMCASCHTPKRALMGCSLSFKSRKGNGTFRCTFILGCTSYLSYLLEVLDVAVLTSGKLHRKQNGPLCVHDAV